MDESKDKLDEMLTADTEVETASNRESTPKKSSKKALVIVVALAVVAVLVAGGVYVYNQHQAEVAEANVAAEAVYNGFQAQLDKIAEANRGEEVTHEAIIAAIVSLNDLKATVEADSTTMYDGTHEGRDKVLKNIDSSIMTLKERIAKEYDETLATNTVDVNAEGVTKDALNAANEALAGLKTLMGADKEKVEILDGESYDAMIKNIDELSAAYVAKVEEIKAAEEAAAAKAAEEAAAAEAAAQAQAAQSNNSGYYGGGSSYNGGGYDSGYSNNGGGSGGYSGGYQGEIPGYTYYDSYGGIYMSDEKISIEDWMNGKRFDN